MNNMPHVRKNPKPLEPAKIALDTGTLFFSIVLEPPDFLGEGYMQRFSLGVETSENTTNKTLPPLSLQKLLADIKKQPTLKPLLRPLKLSLLDSDGGTDNDDCVYFLNKFGAEDDAGAGRNDDDGLNYFSVQTDIGSETASGAIPLESAKPLLRKALIICINSGLLTQRQSADLFTFIDNVGHVAPKPNEVPNLAEARARRLGVARWSPPEPIQP